jgi:intein/homing endonuclease
MSLEELYKKREERTPRIFNREYQCSPVYSTKAFFTREKLHTKMIINKDLTEWKARLNYLPKNEVVAGFDIGKKTHPSHLSVFELVNGKLRMVHQKWMDGWAYSNGKQFFEVYPSQLEYLKMCIANFKIKQLIYDNTRGEFEAFAEQGLLPREMEPVVFTNKLKNSLAANFERLVEREQIELFDEKRLIEQICAVTGDLQAMQSAGGHGDCYDDKTEVLTKSGWKFFNDLSYTDEIATLKEHKFLEYQKPSKIIKERYKGKMYEIATTQVNLLVTPRHKLFVKQPGKTKHYELIVPEEIEGKQVQYKKDAIWKGTEKKFFELDVLKIEMDSFLKFIGYFVSEGYTIHNKAIQICQMPGWKSNKMFEDLKELPFNVKHSKKQGTEGVRFCSTKLVKWSKENLGTRAINKHLPNWIFSLSTRQLKILLDALVLGDGSYSYWPDYVGTNNGYSTVSKELADQIQEITLKIGWCSNIYFSDANIGRKGMFGIGNYRGYKISFVQNKKQPIVHKHNKSDRWIDYNGDIYCVTVPNHIIYVRREGKPVWSGNSFWSTCLAILCVKDQI